eukprot:403335130
MKSYFKFSSNKSIPKSQDPSQNLETCILKGISDIYEYEQLIERLNEIESDLQTTYLEKRSNYLKQQSSSQNDLNGLDLEDELKQAIQEIDEKEKVIKQVAQICQFFAIQCRDMNRSTTDQTDLISELQRANSQLSIQTDQYQTELIDKSLKIDTLCQEIYELTEQMRDEQDLNRQKLLEIRNINQENKKLKQLEKSLTQQLDQAEKKQNEILNQSLRTQSALISQYNSGDSQKAGVCGVYPEKEIIDDQLFFSLRQDHENFYYDDNDKENQIENLQKKLKQANTDLQELEKALQRNLDKIQSLELQNATLNYEAKNLREKLEDISLEKEEEQRSIMLKTHLRKESINGIQMFENNNHSPDCVSQNISPLNKQLKDINSFNGSSSGHSSPLLMAGCFNDSPIEKQNQFKGFTLYQTDNYATQSSQAYYSAKNQIQNFDILVRQSSIQQECPEYSEEIQILKQSDQDTKVPLLKRQHIMNTRTKRDDAEIEFFKMLVLCYKLNHPQMSKICHINSEKLYRRAKSENITFFKFQEWIEKQVNTKTLSVLYSFSSLYKTSKQSQIVKQSNNLNDTLYINYEYDPISEKENQRNSSMKDCSNPYFIYEEKEEEDQDQDLSDSQNIDHSDHNNQARLSRVNRFRERRNQLTDVLKDQKCNIF